jgi:hypothetical protein
LRKGSQTRPEPDLWPSKIRVTFTKQVSGTPSARTACLGLSHHTCYPLEKLAATSYTRCGEREHHLWHPRRTAVLPLRLPPFLPSSRHTLDRPAPAARPTKTVEKAILRLRCGDATKNLISITRRRIDSNQIFMTQFMSYRFHDLRTWSGVA